MLFLELEILFIFFEDFNIINYNNYFYLKVIYFRCFYLFVDLIFMYIYIDGNDLSLEGNWVFYDGFIFFFLFLFWGIVEFVGGVY